MWLVPVVVTLVASLASATPFRRDGTSINASLDKVSAQITTINNTLNTLYPGVIGTIIAVQIQDEAEQLLKDINSAAGTADESAPLSDKESASVAFSVAALTGDIYGLLDNFVSKKPQFDRAILGVGSASGIVKSDLQQIMNATDKFGSALTVKFVPSVKNLSPLLLSAIDHHFQEALKVYA